MTEATYSNGDNSTPSDQEYLDAVDAEAIRRGYMEPGESLVATTGPEPWLSAWREDPTLTAEDQVDEEIHCAAQSM